MGFVLMEALLLLPTVLPPRRLHLPLYCDVPRTWAVQRSSSKIAHAYPMIPPKLTGLGTLQNFLTRLRGPQSICIQEINRKRTECKNVILQKFLSIECRQQTSFLL